MLVAVGRVVARERDDAVVEVGERSAADAARTLPPELGHVAVVRGHDRVLVLARVGVAGDRPHAAVEVAEHALADAPE